MKKDWYKNAIIYGVDVSRFYDSNNDGVGDLNGVTAKLDYIQSLGANCLWLLPFFPSARRDNGYDVTDYRSVDSDLGTLEDFTSLVEEVHQRGMKVVIELVVHHTSDQHPWFKAASTDRHSDYHDYYVWSDEKCDDPDDQPVFAGEEGSVWRRAEAVGAYYHHKFYHFEPDLNVANGRVWAEIEHIADFWLDKGIDGFRLDAATHMFGKKGVAGTAVDAGRYMEALRWFVDKRRSGVVLLGEADVGPEKLQEYFKGDSRMHMLYNFLLNNSMYLALARGQAGPIIEQLRQLNDVTDNGTWMNFLRNLDEVDLEQLSDAERQDVFEVFAPEPNMQIYGSGIRRAVPEMLASARQLRMAYSLLYAMPGVPMITYGSEIGMGDDLSLSGRSSVRLPMQWRDDQHGGFSDATINNSTLDSVMKEGAFGYEKVNVAAQEEDPDSLLHFFRDLIQLRKKHPNIGQTPPVMIDSRHESVVVVAYDTVVTLHNLSDQAQSFDVSLPTHATAIWGQDYVDTKLLEPYGYSWIDIAGGAA